MLYFRNMKSLLSHSQKLCFQVCDQHFPEDSMKWEKTTLDKKTGNYETKSLSVPRLVDGAIPSLNIGNPEDLDEKSPFKMIR